MSQLLERQVELLQEQVNFLNEQAIAHEKEITFLRDLVKQQNLIINGLVKNEDSNLVLLEHFFPDMGR